MVLCIAKNIVRFPYRRGEPIADGEDGVRFGRFRGCGSVDEVGMSSTLGAGFSRALAVFAARDHRLMLHDAVDLVTQDFTNSRIGMIIVAMKDGIVVIDGIRGSRPTYKRFNPGGQPG